jgi:hypothetical protein
MNYAWLLLLYKNVSLLDSVILLDFRVPVIFFWKSSHN